MTLNQDPSIPDEVRSLFNWDKTHWKIIELVIEEDTKVNHLHAFINDTEVHVEKCLKDLLKAGWCREFSPPGVALGDRGNDIIQISKFAYVALENMLKCMDMNSYK